MVSSFDHQIFALLVAPPDLHGIRLIVAIALARWAVFCGPAVLALLWLSATAEDRAAAVASAVTICIAVLVAMILSTLIELPRPFMGGGATNYLDHVRDSSFPSDHATLLFALAFSLWVNRPARNPLLWLPALALAIAVGWARVYLGAHYPIDIAGAAVVAAVTTALTESPPGRIAVTSISILTEKVRWRLAGLWRVAPRQHRRRLP